MAYAVYAFRSAFAGTLWGIVIYEFIGPANGAPAGIAVGTLVTLGLFVLHYKFYQYRAKKAKKE